MGCTDECRSDMDCMGWIKEPSIARLPGANFGTWLDLDRLGSDELDGLAG